MVVAIVVSVLVLAFGAVGSPVVESAGGTVVSELDASVVTVVTVVVSHLIGVTCTGHAATAYGACSALTRVGLDTDPSETDPVELVAAPAAELSATKPTMIAGTTLAAAWIVRRQRRRSTSIHLPPNSKA